MYNNLDYLYSQLNELNSKIGSTYNYIDSNNLSEAKINQLNLKCDYMIARANKIEQKIKLIENQDPDSHEDYNNKIISFKHYMIIQVIFTILFIIAIIQI